MGSGYPGSAVKVYPIHLDEKTVMGDSMRLQTASRVMMLLLFVVTATSCRKLMCSESDVKNVAQVIRQVIVLGGTRVLYDLPLVSQQ
jgi:hypothetical protein